MLWLGIACEFRASRLHGLHVLCMGDQQGIVIEGAVLKVLRNLPHCELCPANEWSWLIQLQPVMYSSECQDNQSSAKWFLRKYWKQNPESYSFIQSNPNCLFLRQLAPGADRAHLRSGFESCPRVREAAEIRYLSLSGSFRRTLQIFTEFQSSSKMSCTWPYHPVAVYSVWQRLPIVSLRFEDLQYSTVDRIPLLKWSNGKSHSLAAARDSGQHHLLAA